MKTQLLSLTAVLLLAVVGYCGEKEKVYEVGKDGLTIEGKVAIDNAKIKVVVAGKTLSLPANVFLVKLSAARRYRLTLEGKEFDGVIALLGAPDQQLAVQISANGKASLSLDLFKDGVFKLCAGSHKPGAPFLLTVKDEGEIAAPEVGTGLRFTGELGKAPTASVAVRFKAGKSYVIDMNSPDTKALDPYLLLFDIQGKKLAEDDDAGGNLNARITFACVKDGIYRIVASSYGPGKGPFLLSVKEASTASGVAQLKDKLDALTKKLGPDHHQVVDARIAWQNADRFAKMSDKQKADVARANQLSAEVGALFRTRDFKKALSLAKEAADLRKETHGAQTLEYSVALNNVAIIRESLGELAEAERVQQEVLAIRKEVLGAKHPGYAHTLNNLAHIHAMRKEPAKAEPLCLEALAIRRATLGADHPDTAESMHNLATLYREPKDLGKAETLFQDALTVRKKWLGVKHPDYAASLHGLGLVYLERHELAKGEPLILEAAQIRKSVFGAKHPSYAASLEGLGRLHKLQGEYAKAELAYRQAVDLCLAVHGENDPVYASALHQLGLFYDSNHEHVKAEPLLLKAMSVRKKVLGEKNGEFADSIGSLGLHYKSIGQFATARQYYAQALAIREKLVGTEHPDYALTLGNLGALCLAEMKLDEAEKHTLAAMAIRKKTLGEKSLDYAESLNNLSAIYQAQQNYFKAAPIRQQAVEVYKGVVGASHPAYALSVHNLGELRRALGDDAEAERLLLEALKIKKGILAGQTEDCARTLTSLASLKGSQHQFQQQERLLLEAQAIRKKVLGENHPSYASSLANLGVLHLDQFRLDKAEQFLRDALTIRERVLGKSHPDCASTLESLAAIQLRRGNFDEAARLSNTAIAILGEAIGSGHPDYAEAKLRLATVLHYQGRIKEAVAATHDAQNTLQRVFGEIHPAFALSLTTQAGTWNELGDPARAAALCYRSLEIQDKLGTQVTVTRAATCFNLATALRFQGELEQAERYCRLSVQLHKKIRGELHPDYASSLHNLATVLASKGDAKGALETYRQVLKITKASQGDQHPDYAQSLRNYADVLLTIDPDEAEKSYLKAIEIFKSAPAAGSQGRISKLNNLGILYEAQLHFDKAESCYREAIVLAQIGDKRSAFEEIQLHQLVPRPSTVDLLANHARLARKKSVKNSTPAELRARGKSLVLAVELLEKLRHDSAFEQQTKTHHASLRFDLFAHRLDQLRDLHALEKDPQHLEDAFHIAEQGGARTFIDILVSHRIHLLSGVPAGLQEEEKKWLNVIHGFEAKIEKHSALRLDQRDPKWMAELVSGRKAAQEKLDQLVERLGKEHAQYAALKYPRPCRFDEARNTLADSEVALLLVPGSDRSFMVFVSARPDPDDKTNGIAIIEISDKDKLADLVAPLIDPETLASPRHKILARQAFDAILGPVKDRIKDKNLVIVPNGQLCFLPFEMLVEPDGKYLVEKHRIRYAPSLTALHFIKLWEQKRAKPEVPLFAVGDPVYTKGYQRLEHSGYEVEQIAKLLKAKDEFVLTRDKASKAEVKKLSDANTMAKAKYVHFATHGILGLDRGKQPALMLSQGKRKPKAKDDLFADDEGEGLLQMDEITGLKLNADLVVLSACKSGQGRLHQGEGVTGIARAFLYAGSKGVMCSLWSVDDRETANLMVDFYGHLDKGKLAPEALREAQLAMIRQGKAPYYWAPFILIGE